MGNVAGGFGANGYAGSNRKRPERQGMTTKQKWVTIIGSVIVWSIIILNFIVKPSVPEYVIQLILLLAAQIWWMSVFRKKKSDSN
jgi:uncharacterized membrane protein YoaT (DUF817 family)